MHVQVACIQVGTVSFRGVGVDATCNTMRAKIQYSTPMECLALLLAGMAMSTYGNGESVSQKAMVGMLT